MSVVDRLRGARSRAGGIDADTLVQRVETLRQAIDAAEGHIAEEPLVPARTVIDRAGERLALSRAHTIVALAGATGSGKSSLFNAIAGMPLSQVGVRRPTTGVAHACVWGTEDAPALLDWLGVPPNRRFTRESALDGDDQAALRGLILLDLPDFDSVEQAHRTEVERLLRLVDLVVWVLDPQKYADSVVHRQYLSQFQHHRDITVVVLNQADRLNRADSERVVADLGRLLEADGFSGGSTAFVDAPRTASGIPVFATSAKGQPGLGTLRRLLEHAVARRQAALARLAGDVASVADALWPMVRTEPLAERVEQSTVDELTRTLAAAAGVPIVAEATQRTYRYRATGVLGWPVARWTRRLRPDPLKRLHLGRTRDHSGHSEVELSVTSLPESTAGQRAAVALASRAVADRAGSGLPDPWPAAVVAAARSRVPDVPDALDLAIASVDLGVERKPLWWRAIGFLQWLGALAALVGLGWLAVRAIAFLLGLPLPDGPQVGQLPLPTVLLGGGLLFGILLTIVVRPVVAFAARRVRRRAERRLRDAIEDVAHRFIVEPVQQVLHAYARARAALLTLTGSR